MVYEWWVHTSGAQLTLDTITVQFFQIGKFPAIDVALIEKEYDPAAVGVPDILVPDQAAQVGLVTEERAADSFTVGVYEYAILSFRSCSGCW